LKEPISHIHPGAFGMRARKEHHKFVVLNIEKLVGKRLNGISSGKSR
jgi:hypothetical protein